MPPEAAVKSCPELPLRTISGSVAMQQKGSVPTFMAYIATKGHVDIPGLGYHGAYHVDVQGLCRAGPAQNKERILKAVRKKCQVTYKGRPI
jgi:hypothetical protein